MELNHTCLELLKTLYAQTDYISISTLAEQSGKTERAVRYSLGILDQFFERRHLPFLSREFGRGVYLEHTAQTEEALQEFLAKPTPYQYKFSTEERERFLEICLLVGRRRYVPVADLADRLTVSYGTIAADLENVEKWIEARGLELVKKSRMGLRVQGDETLLQRVCLERLSESVTLSEYERYLCGKPLDDKITLIILNELFEGLDIDFFRDLPKRAEGVLNRVFSDEAFGNLIFFLAILTQRHTSGAAGPVPVNETDDSIQLSDEHSAAVMLLELLSKRLSVTYSPGDCWHLTTQLLSSKSITSGQSKLGRDSARSKRLDLVAAQIVAKIEELYHIDFSPIRKDLIEHLKTHLTPTIYRIRYHKTIVNPIYDELVEKQHRLLQYTAEAVRPLEEYCGAPVSDQEISYIALYFLAAINQQSPQLIRRPQVVVACGSGYGTAQVVASQLSRLFDVDVMAVLSGRDVSELVKNRNLDCDYIISTVDLPRLSDDSYIKVHPIFTHNDYERILQLLDARKQNWTSGRYLETAGNLVEIARRHGADTNMEQLRYEFLSALIRTSNRSDFLGVGTRQPTLADLLQPSLIRMDVSCRDWREVVAASTVSLEEHGYVTAGYKDAIIRNILNFGPGMVMFPGTLISHAGPSDGCMRLGFGFMTLHHPVSFHNEQYDPVRIVFTLSAVDSTSHMDALMQLFNLLSDQAFRQQLFEARTKENVLRTIQKFSE